MSNDLFVSLMVILNQHVFIRPLPISVQQKQMSATTEAVDSRPTSLPASLESSIRMTYRSVGIGTFGVIMRWGGMPLEKIALFMNSSQVSGKGQFGQAVKLTFKDGTLTRSILIMCLLMATDLVDF